MGTKWARVVLWEQLSPAVGVPVPVPQHWDPPGAREEMGLSPLCQKAGLRVGCSNLGGSAAVAAAQRGGFWLLGTRGAPGAVRGGCPAAGRGTQQPAWAAPGAPKLLRCSQARASFYKTTCDSGCFLHASADILGAWLTWRRMFRLWPCLWLGVLSLLTANIRFNLLQAHDRQLNWQGRLCKYTGGGGRSSVLRVPAGSRGCAGASCSCPLASR